MLVGWNCVYIYEICWLGCLFVIILLLATVGVNVLEYGFWYHLGVICIIMGLFDVFLVCGLCVCVCNCLFVWVLVVCLQCCLFIIIAFCGALFVLVVA